MLRAGNHSGIGSAWEESLRKKIRMMRSLVTTGVQPCALREEATRDRESAALIWNGHGAIRVGGAQVLPMMWWCRSRRVA
ncbi:hypothetical protein GGR62_002493 [Xanthomonas campestris]|nr:hypothetical protein [Xanthomonas sp. 3075]